MIIWVVEHEVTHESGVGGNHSAGPHSEELKVSVDSVLLTLTPLLDRHIFLDEVDQTLVETRVNCFVTLEDLPDEEFLHHAG